MLKNEVKKMGWFFCSNKLQAFLGELQWRTIGKQEVGQSQTEVGRWLNERPSVVHSDWQQFPKPRCGIQEVQPRTGNRHDERRWQIFGYMLTRYRTTISNSSQIFHCCRHRKCCFKFYVPTLNVHRRHHEGGLYASRPAICVPLTSQYRRERLSCVHQHVHWKRDTGWLFSSQISHGLASKIAVRVI